MAYATIFRLEPSPDGVQIDRPSSEPPQVGTDRVVVLGPMTDGSAAIGWSERVRHLLVGQSDAIVICDVARLSGSAAEVIDGLARLQLTAISCGGAIRLRGADADLVALLELFGLWDVLSVDDE